MSIGYVKLHRDIQGTWIHKDPVFFKAYCDILMNVNWEDREVLIGSTPMACQKGEALMSLDSWAKIFGGDWNKGKVRRFFSRLEKANAIRTQNERQTTRLKVVNIEDSEPNPNANRTQDERNPTPTKEERRKKKEIELANAHKHLDAIVELCTYFKEVTGKRIIIGSTPSQILNSTKGKAIAARLNEEVTVEQIKQIIEYKNRMWQGSQRQYLCFETLLRPTKITKYLEEVMNQDQLEEQISQPKTLTDHFKKYYEPSKFSKLERKSKLVEYEQQFKQQQFKLVNISKSYSNETITPALIFEFTTLPLGRNLVGSTVDKKLSSFKNWFSKLSDFQQNKGDIREQLELFNKRNDRN